MNYAVVRYTVRPECRDANAAKVQAVVEQLQLAAPENLSYLVLVNDTGEFLHMAASSGDSSALTGLPAFRDFLADHGQRRAGEISRSVFSLVGEYRPRTMR